MKTYNTLLPFCFLLSISAPFAQCGDHRMDINFLTSGRPVQRASRSASHVPTVNQFETDRRNLDVLAEAAGTMTPMIEVTPAERDSSPVAPKPLRSRAQSFNDLQRLEQKARDREARVDYHLDAQAHHHSLLRKMKRTSIIDRWIDQVQHEFKYGEADIDRVLERVVTEQRRTHAAKEAGASERLFDNEEQLASELIDAPPSLEFVHEMGSGEPIETAPYRPAFTRFVSDDAEKHLAPGPTRSRPAHRVRKQRSHSGASARSSRSNRSMDMLTRGMDQLTHQAQQAEAVEEAEAGTPLTGFTEEQRKLIREALLESRGGNTVQLPFYE